MKDDYSRFLGSDVAQFDQTLTDEQRKSVMNMIPSGKARSIFERHRRVKRAYDLSKYQVFTDAMKYLEESLYYKHLISDLVSVVNAKGDLMLTDLGAQVVGEVAEKFFYDNQFKSNAEITDIEEHLARQLYISANAVAATEGMSND